MDTSLSASALLKGSINRFFLDRAEAVEFVVNHLNQIDPTLHAITTMSQVKSEGFYVTIAIVGSSEGFEIQNYLSRRHGI